MFAAFGLSDAGCVRGNNEDYFIPDEELGIFILADGMGGANAGELASRIAATSLREYLVANNHFESIESLEQGFFEANEAVREAAAKNPHLKGMGTTLVAAVKVHENKLHVCSVGDSRAYLCDGSKLSPITHDQTWVAEVGTKLGLTENALKTHPMRHVLTMAIGCTDELRVQSHLLTLQAGNQVLLCSDGLHGVVGEETLERTLLSQKSLGEKCHYLVEAARASGGPDNITVLLIQLV
ncbi:MAG: serine/threonine-protein phosphatase [Acidobacteriaceae bacterium]|nr:serine/threonine-protein phosphatase [Acidobacteriaceae bacterium]